MQRCISIFAVAAASILTPGCIFFADDDDHAIPVGCPEGERCDSSQPLGPVHGLRSDGTVDVTADEAWPNRPTEPPPLSAEELAQACARLAACTPVDPDTGTVDDARRMLLALCVDPIQAYFWEERAVPTSSKNERWTFEARAILASTGDCNAVVDTSTQRPDEIVCQEDGCWWFSLTKPIPTVTCNGDVALLATVDASFTRDCSRAFAKCDESSPTGCTDRPPVACEHPASDRCDGAVRIGCDGEGRVSFHDCGRVPGGTCGEVGDGLGCVYPTSSACTAGPQCTGDTLSLCVFGEAVNVDCKALGMAACANGRCVAP
jgi:hypothetical protein